MEENNSSAEQKESRTVSVAVIGGAIIAVLLILSTLWINRLGQNDTREAVKAVSEFYLRELTDRREQGIIARINVHVNNVKAALKILSPNDLQNVETLSAFLGRMKIFCGVDQFAFVDAQGKIFTPEGIAPNSDEYFFINQPVGGVKIFTGDPSTGNKIVTVVVPVEGLTFQGAAIKSCFIRASLSKFLEGILVHTTAGEMTFFNLYYKDGESLTDAVLSSFDLGSNLITTLKDATFDDGSSLEQIDFDFKNSRGGMASFTYRGVKEMIYYRPVQNTGWMLSYLIRKNKIEDEIAAVNTDMRDRALLQILLTRI